MSKKLVITIIGKDRPGMVDKVSETVLAHEGNWRDSRMTRLGGRFAGVALIEVPKATFEALEAALSKLEDEGIWVYAQETSRLEIEGDFRHLRLELFGQDRPGIVQQISHTLAERKVSIDDMSTSLEQAPMAGGDLFRFEADLLAPADADLDGLRHDLESLADDLMVEIGLGAELL